MEEEFLRAIVVDDEAIICNGLKQYFDWRKVGIKLVGAFRTAQQALEYIRDNPVDILVTDINMNGMNGIALVEQVESMGKQLRVVFISAYMEFEYAYQAVKFSRVDDFVLKPIDPEELSRALEKSVNKIREGQRLERLPLSEAAQAYYKRTPLFANMRGEIIAKVKKAEREGVEECMGRVAAALEGREDGLSIFQHWACDLIGQCEDMLELDGIAVNDGENTLAFRKELLRSETVSDGLARLHRQLEGMARQVRSFLENRYSAVCIRAVEIVEREFSNSNFSMQMLADELNVSANYISARFKKEVGVGFSRYLNSLRIERAKKLLLETDKRVFEICRYVGIEDVRYFTRVFKSQVGVTPIEFRNLAEVKRVIRAAELALSDGEETPGEPDE